jgi:[ribosomal protein S5]-alanine N-acetyltransferase
MELKRSLYPFPTLETERLLLRQTTSEDVIAVFAIFADPNVTQFHNLDTFTHVEQAIAVIERRSQGFELGQGIRWGIALKSTQQLIGSCGFTWHPSEAGAEIGYELSSQFWSQGIMSEALSAILQYGFEVRHLEFVMAEVMLDNVASQKLLMKLGFQRQGILKQQGYWKGEYHDLEQYRLTKVGFGR